MLVLIVGQRYALICVGLVGRIVEVSAFSVENQVFGIRGVLKYVRSRGFAFWSHGVYKATEARLSMSGGGIESGESGGGAVHSQWSRKLRKSSSRVSQ